MDGYLQVSIKESTRVAEVALMRNGQSTAWRLQVSLLPRPSGVIFKAEYVWS